MMKTRSLALLLAASLAFATPAFADRLDEAVRRLDAGNYRGAYSIFLQMSEQGDRRAQYGLALMYLQGQGVERDLDEATYWLQESAKRGFAESQYVLGMHYSNGIGVEKNYLESSIYFTDAAANRHWLAAYYLGTQFEFGLGVPQSWSIAYALYDLFVDKMEESDYLGRDGKKRLAGKMSESDMKVARALIRRLHNRWGLTVSDMPAAEKAVRKELGL